jgi:D-tyrosyl-tRNA(Tyr) deacylase
MVRAVLQRVAHARVVVEGRTVGEASRGILALVGVANGDTEEDIRWLHDKILDCRLFDSAEGKRWAGSVRSLKLDVMLVSQFTLHAVTRKPKPDFHNSMSGPAARGLFDTLVTSMRESHGSERVHTGEFGAMMEVSLLNDGPVTILLDSWNKAECGGHEPPTGSSVDALDTPTPSSTPTPTMAGAGGVGKGARSGGLPPVDRSQPSKKESSWKAYRASLDAAGHPAAPDAPVHLSSDPAARGVAGAVSETSAGAVSDASEGASTVV